MQETIIIKSIAREDLEHGININLKRYQPNGNLLYLKENNKNFLQIEMKKIDSNNFDDNIIEKCKLISTVLKDDVENGINKYIRLGFEPYGNFVSNRAVRNKKEIAHLTILMVKRKNKNNPIKECKIISYHNIEDYYKNINIYQKKGFKINGNMITHNIIIKNNTIGYYTVLMVK